MSEDRLQKIIARAGFASRREAEQMIREGRVTINGRVVSELGTKADAQRDHIKVDGKLITRAEKLRYILLYKPKEVMTTVNDPEGRPTVMDLLRGVKERVFPVGRLDYHSEGLLLITNDGELAFVVSHPTQGSVKTYHVKVRGVAEDRLIEKLERGITIDGVRTRPCEIERMRTTGRTDEEGNSWYEVRLREGRTQQIRKMFKAIGHPVTKLKRVAIGALRDPKLSAGQWRELTRAEVKLLESKETRKAPARTRKPAAAARRKKAEPAARGRRTAAGGAKKSASKTRASAPARKSSSPAKKRAASTTKRSASTTKRSRTASSGRK